MLGQKMISVVCVTLVISGCTGTELSSARDRTWGGELIEIPATTWIDPDGCEHWMFDTGAEGFATTKFDRNGKPICNIESIAAETAMQVPGPLTFNVRQLSSSAFSLGIDAYFDLDSVSLKRGTEQELIPFFVRLRENGAREITLIGHTDDQGSDEYNLQLSLRRAEAVARLAETIGLIAIPSGLGEAAPIATNRTPEGRALNRRVNVNVRD